MNGMADNFSRLTEEELALLKSFPELTDQEKAEINDMFQHYVFYKTTPKGRMLWTSCCHKNGIQHDKQAREMTPEHSRFFERRHNDSVTCPCCGKTAVLKAAGLKTADLAGYINILILHCIKGELYAQAYQVAKDYSRWGLTGYAHYWHLGSYHFRIGRAIEFTDHYGWWYTTRDEGKIKRRPNVRDPFKKGWMYGSGNEDYFVIHPEAIKESDLKYCGYEEYWWPRRSGSNAHWNLIRFMAFYCVYPRAVEMLLKNGFRDVIWQYIFNGVKNAASIKWDEQDPRKAFGLTTSELKAFMATREKDIELVAAYKKLRKNGIRTDFPELVDQLKTLGYGINIVKFIDVCLRYKTTPRKFISYLERYTGGCHAGGYRSLYDIYRHWTDYIDAAKAIGYDLSVFNVCFPKDLQEAHDNATAEHNRRLLEQQEEERRRREEERRREEAERIKRDPKYAAEVAERKRLEELRQKKEAEIFATRDKKYTWGSNGYIIRPARTAEEIIAEGNALSHCVGGYAARHLAGKLTICFLRLSSQPDKPLITIELDTDGRLVQAHGYKNEQDGSPDPRKKYAHIIDPWLQWIATGSKRDKQGNPIIKNKKKEDTAA